MTVVAVAVVVGVRVWHEYVIQKNWL